MLLNLILSYLNLKLIAYYSTHAQCPLWWLTNQLIYHFNPNHPNLDCCLTCILNQLYLFQYDFQQTTQILHSRRSFHYSSISSQFHYSKNLFLITHFQSLLHFEGHLLLLLIHLQTHFTFSCLSHQLEVSEITHLLQIQYNSKDSLKNWEHYLQEHSVAPVNSIEIITLKFQRSLCVCKSLFNLPVA
jgi:hypothetical protein